MALDRKAIIGVVVKVLVAVAVSAVVVFGGMWLIDLIAARS